MHGTAQNLMRGLIVVIIAIAGVQCSYVTMTLNPILCVQQRLDLRVT